MLRRTFNLLILAGTGWLLLSGRPVLSDPVAVASVSITGCVNVPEARIREVVTLRPGDPVDAARLETERKAILALGYFRSVSATQQAQDGKAQVQFRVVEWPKVAFIRVLGNSVVDQTAIRGVITTRLGQVLCIPQLQADIQSIERLYRDQGYVVRVSENIVDEATRSGILRFELLEMRIAELAVEGGDDELRRRARQALMEEPPAFYRPEAVAMDQRRLLEVRGVKRALARVEVIMPGQVRINWVLNPPPQMKEQLPR